MTIPFTRYLALLCLAFGPTLLTADPAEILAAEAHPEGSGQWTLYVTLQHADTGWDHYADGWEVTAPDGTRLGFRELLHPHVHEQPFTRSLRGVGIPAGLGHVLIRARDNLDGWGADTLAVPLD